jgi:hypothetical protein
VKYTAVLLIILALVVVTQFLIARSTDSTEQQRYSVLYTDGDFEIRRYPEALMASVDSRDTSLRGSANRNFRRLAGYIFGGNQSGQKIAMTAPVHMENADSGSVMSFVMPSSMQSKDLPVPNDPGIVFHTAPEQIVAVIRFSGFASDDDIREKSVLLEEWLSTKGLSPQSAFKYLGYNPPYQIVNRRNEVAVEISASEAAGIVSR